MRLLGDILYCALCGYPTHGDFYITVPGHSGHVMHSLYCGPILNGDIPILPTHWQEPDRSFSAIDDITIAMIIIGDGRDEYLQRCVASLNHIHGPITERWMYDDTGNDAYRKTLGQRYPRWAHINGGPRQGCAGAFQQVWDQVGNLTSAKYVFLIEQDFEFHRVIDLNEMAALLEQRPHLVEVALRRQPWNEQEKAAGGIVEWHPDWYADKRDEHGREWLEQRMFFTTNCPLFRTTLFNSPWPPHQPGRYSEGTFHHQLMANGTAEVPGDQVTYAYWGSRASGTWVQHIGEHRIGTGY